MENGYGERNVRKPHIMGHPGSSGPWEWRTLGVADPGSGGQSPIRLVELLSYDYTNPNTNPKTLALTLADHHDDFESFCAPVFCDFVGLRNYSCTVDGAVVTSY